MNILEKFARFRESEFRMERGKRNGNNILIAGEGLESNEAVAVHLNIKGCKIRAGMHNGGRHLPQDALSIGETQTGLRICVCDGVTGYDRATGQFLGTKSGLYSKLLAGAVQDPNRPVANNIRLFGKTHSNTANPPAKSDYVYNDTTVQVAEVYRTEGGWNDVTITTCGGPDTGWSAIRLPDGKIIQQQPSANKGKAFSEGVIEEKRYTVPTGSVLLLATDGYKNVRTLDELFSASSTSTTAEDFVKAVDNLSQGIRKDDATIVTVEL